jgi:hypothetical protein
VYSASYSTRRQDSGYQGSVHCLDVPGIALRKPSKPDDHTNTEQLSRSVLGKYTELAITNPLMEGVRTETSVLWCKCTEPLGVIPVWCMQHAFSIAFGQHTYLHSAGVARCNTAQVLMHYQQLSWSLHMPMPSSQVALHWCILVVFSKVREHRSFGVQVYYGYLGKWYSYAHSSYPTVEAVGSMQLIGCIHRKLGTTTLDQARMFSTLPFRANCFGNSLRIPHRRGNREVL